MAKIPKWWRWFVKGGGGGSGVRGRGGWGGTLERARSENQPAEREGERKVKTGGRSAAVWQPPHMDHDVIPQQNQMTSSPL